MVEKTKVVEITETKETVFNILKNVAPSVFGSKTFADVEHFGDDPSAPNDNIRIRFVEETES